jgi:hypothetical protein
MALIVFRCKAAGEIFMFAETAQRIFEIVGKAAAPRGVLTAAEVPAALERLHAAVEDEKARLKTAAQAQRDAGGNPADDDAAVARGVTLGQRAFPLLEMLRAAQRKSVEVTWGI